MWVGHRHITTAHSACCWIKYRGILKFVVLDLTSMYPTSTLWCITPQLGDVSNLNFVMYQTSIWWCIRHHLRDGKIRSKVITGVCDNTSTCKQQTSNCNRGDWTLSYNSRKKAIPSMEIRSCRSIGVRGEAIGSIVTWATCRPKALESRARVSAQEKGA